MKIIYVFIFLILLLQTASAVETSYRLFVGQEEAASGADNEWKGVRIYTKYSINLTNVTTYPSDTSPNCRLTNDSNFILATSSVTSNLAKFGYLLNQDTYYRVVCGGSGIMGYNLNNFAQVNNTIINITDQIYGGNIDNGDYRTIRYVTGSYDFDSVVSLNSPVNFANSSNSVKFNCTAAAPSGSTVINISLWENSTGTFKINQTTTVNTNNYTATFTNTYATDSSILWTCGAYDSLNVTTFATSNRTVVIPQLIENSQTYNNPIFETGQQTFSINLTANSGITLSSGFLVYNGTNYNGTLSIVGSNYVFSATVNIPSINSQINNTFYWSFVTNLGTHNSTTNTQTVNDLQIDNCTTNTIQILNYTFYNEDTRVQLNASTANISANLYLKFSSDFSGTSYIYFANNTNTNPIKVCISTSLANGTNYRVDSTIQYSATGFVTEYHIIQNTTLNTTVQPLSYNLYDLVTTSSQEFLITYKDSNFNAVSGALITLTRQYLELGQFLPVEIAETDTDGRTIEHFVLNDQVYTIYVRKNNQLLSTFENIRVYCSSAITDCKLNLFEPGTSSNTASFINYRNSITSTEYNRTTRVYAVQYLTTDSSSKTFNLTIIKADNYGTTILCSQQALSYAGTLSCTIPSSTNGTAIARMTVDGEPLFTDSFSITSLLDSDLNPIRFLFAFILVATLPLMGIGSGVMTIVFGLLGLVAAGMFALIDWGGYIGASSALMWFIIAGVIIIWKASKGRQDG